METLVSTIYVAKFTCRNILTPVAIRTQRVRQTDWGLSGNDHPASVQQSPGGPLKGGGKSRQMEAEPRQDLDTCQIGFKEYTFLM